MSAADTTHEETHVFYAKDVHQMNLLLGKFLQKSGADTVLLVDKAGHLVARQGGSSPAGEDTISALVAGTYAASQAMAEMLGASEFSSVIPCGHGRNIMLLPAGEESMLAITFCDETTVALLRTYALETVRRLSKIMDHAPEEIGEPDERIQPDTFDREIDDALDDVFG